MVKNPARPYHSALAAGDADLRDVQPTRRTHYRGSFGVQNDIIRHGLPKEFKRCDVIYAEPPWPAGFTKFDERADIGYQRSYKIFAAKIAVVLETWEQPHFLTIGKTMAGLLPEPRGTTPMMLNGNPATLAWWNTDFAGPVQSSDTFAKYLGSQYDCMGDWCCGYGAALFNFIEGGGKSFVGADHNGKCITVLGQLMRETLK